MKRSDSILSSVLLWLLPVVLLIPNVALDITECYTPAEKVCNILLPAAAWLALSAAFRRGGLAALAAIPVMVLCAFQIVLLFLYGQSIIAVDMFLNVVTTNVGEVSELLRNLVMAISTVLVIYLPPIVIGVLAVIKKTQLPRQGRRAALIVAGALAVAGGICAATVENYTPGRTLFPVNVISNIVEAVHRTEMSKAYFETSKDFAFGARATAPDSNAVYVLVIGETARADNWQLNGYGRPSNPRLSKRQGLISFGKVLSESNTTHKSVPLLLSHLGSAEFGDSIYSVKSIITAFGEAGYATAWLSNQHRNGSLIDFFGDEADEHHFLADDGCEHLDMELVGPLAEILNRNSGRPLFVVLHTYGSHFNYKSRYSEEYEFFTPDNSTIASADNRIGLINAYDNTVAYVDAVLDSVMTTIEKTHRPAAVLYVADHGEDIFDDERHRFLHASPTPTYWQLHVPMVLWMSEPMLAKQQQAFDTAMSHRNSDISSSHTTFHTLMHLAGIEAAVCDTTASIASSAYLPCRPCFLNDYNEAVDLRTAGMTAGDFEQLDLRTMRAN